MNKRTILRLGILLIIAVAIYYYITLPAINIHAAGFWSVFIFLLVVVLAFLAFPFRNNPDGMKTSKKIKICIGLILAVIAVYVIGSLLSSPILNASKYQQLMQVEDREFTEDIHQVSYDQIPLLDRSTAMLLGNRKMGSMVDMVSQFEVSDLYSQINYQDKPVRVSPLEYASPIKWLTNQSSGIPAYILIDMASQNTQLVKLDEGIKYSESEYFFRNIYRHLRFHYPTYIFDDINFEIDDDGVPYWIAPVKKFNIGLFGGVTIGKVVLCNAVTGDTTVYDVENVPEWVDRVYSADMLVDLFDYHGTLKHGFLNSVLSQKDCLQTTNGYNYIAMDDDVWVYTGITSVNTDQSNVGFVLMNQRTMESRFYAIEGAIEDSAMSSAEGQVQNLGYVASFPLLLNIANEPTYFIALKDDAGLVKKYAMVNIQKYQWVAIGDTVKECEKSYRALLSTNGINSQDQSQDAQSITGRIAKLVQVTLEGNSHYYIVLTGKDIIYDAPVADFPDIILYDVGDQITLEYEETGEVKEVDSIGK